MSCLPVPSQLVSDTTLSLAWARPGPCQEQSVILCTDINGQRCGYADCSIMHCHQSSVWEV